MAIKSPGGVLRTGLRCPKVIISIEGVEFLANLIVIDSKGLDVILGMNWLGKHKAMIDCALRAVSLTRDDGTVVDFKPKLAPQTATDSLLNSLKEMDVLDVRVVKEYTDVFPEELPGLPPDREIEFAIELVPGTAPIAKRPYRMPANELAEMKKQIQDLLEKGYVRPSTSPCGAPVLFVKKKIGRAHV